MASHRRAHHRSEPSRGRRFRVVMVVVALACSATASAANPSSPASATRGFAGAFAGGTTVMQLRYDASNDRYIGSLTTAGIVLPIDAKASGRSLDGTVVIDGRPRPFSASIDGDALRISGGGRRETLVRVADPATTLSAVEAASARQLAGELLSGVAPADRAAAPTATRRLSAGPGDGGLGTILGAAGTDATGAATGTGTGTGNGGTTAPAAPAPVARAGTRLTYLVGTAKVPGANAYEPDANGGFVDDQGNRYSQATGGGSQSYLQLTINDVANGIATADERWYAIDLNARAVFAGPVNGYQLPGDRGGEYWISPQILEQIPDGNQNGVTVVRLTYPLGGRNFRAIRIIDAPNTTHSQHTYDLDTGALIVFGSSGMSQGSAVIVISMLQSIRQVKLPWIGRQAPAHVLQQLPRTMQWSGTTTTVVDNAYTGTFRMARRWDVTSTNPSAMAYRETTSIDFGSGAPQTQPTIDQIAPIARLWIDPQVLAGLRQGQVLDDDRLTGLRTTVLGAQSGMLVISTQGPLSRALDGYDLQTGFRRAFQTQERTAPGTTTVYLQRA